MPKNIRIKRRRSGASGPPSALLNGELAYNEVNGTLYYGAGLGANTSATTIVAIGGPGAFVNLVSNQTIAGSKQFSGTVTFSGALLAPTPPTNDNSTAAATTAYVRLYVQSQTTDNITEGSTNLYFTPERSNTAAAAYLAPFFAGKANVVHNHLLSEVSGLLPALAQKLDINAVIDCGQISP